MIRQSITNDQDMLTFGKFKGCTVEYVLHNQPSYLLWLHENKIAEFSKEMLTLAEEFDYDRRMDKSGGFDYAWFIEDSFF